MNADDFKTVVVEYVREVMADSRRIKFDWVM